MTPMIFTLAIVGAGPRGLFALECFLGALQDVPPSRPVRIAMFEESAHWGCGPVWRQDQAQGNWSNVTERVLVLPERPQMQIGPITIPAFPSYHVWAGLAYDRWPSERVDTFLPRGAIGKYFAERFRTMAKPLIDADALTLMNDRVDCLSLSGGAVAVTTRKGATLFAEQVLLTVGHQPTEADPQLTAWSRDVVQAPHCLLFTDAYPVETIVAELAGMTDVTIAVRGYGLATIDILRAIASEHGAFEIMDARTRAQRFSLAADAALKVAPFSLDGLTMGPKPLTPAIDAQFAPTAAALETLRAALSNRAAQQSATDADFLLDRICPVIAEVFLALAAKPEGSPTRLEETCEIVRAWIADQTVTHPSILDVALPPEQIIDAFLDMATGAHPVTLDYCAGQVWRHCQSTIYAALSHGSLTDDVMAAVIALDEQMKRYAFGPPLESLQQIKALHAAGILDLRFLRDPDIDLREDGWTLSNGQEDVTATVMINAVLDAPKIRSVTSILLTKLLSDGAVEAVHDDLGVVTASDGLVVSASGAELPIALLGRLSKGSVVGVDAILECFGSRPQAWADAAVVRFASHDARDVPRAS